MKKLKNKKSILNNEEGMAIIETLPLLIIFVILIGYGLGMWGAVHRGILSSISARNYAFQTFRNRVDLTYHKDVDSSDANQLARYNTVGFRFHAIQSLRGGESGDPGFFATQLPLGFGREGVTDYYSERQPASNSQIHNSQIHALSSRNRQVKVNPIWIMVGYGMCVDAACGGESE